ncbi:MAG: N-succinylarginine dihydrolase [Candidatus Marinamargulisbacteria bacterium]
MNSVPIFINAMPGPTNHFGGHAYGNTAAMASQYRPMNPQKAAIEWLDHVDYIHHLGARQCILPPQPRPLKIHAKDPTLQQVSSAFMWMANAGHVFPSQDTNQSTDQFVPANMIQTPHRINEYAFHRYWLKKMMPQLRCRHRLSWPDEGAANTIRLWNDPNKSAIYLLVHGPKKSYFPIRQHPHSWRELIQMTGIKHPYVMTQNNRAIDHGAFHNDVIAFGFHRTLICHEYAFQNQTKTLKELSDYFHHITGQSLTIITIKNNELSLQDSIHTYLFNSQVIQMDERNHLICPSRVQTHTKSRYLVDQWVKKGVFSAIHYCDLTTSLMNGGGPACLRLPIYLSMTAYKNIPLKFKPTPKKIMALRDIVMTGYPTTCVIKNTPSDYAKFESVIHRIFKLYH